MGYIQRNNSGEITGVFSKWQSGVAEEYIEGFDDLPVSIRDYSAAVQSVLDSKARDLGYDNIFTAVTYADEPAVAEFQNEGKTLRAWRSIVWDYAYSELAKVEAGTINTPTINEFTAGIPLYE